MNSEEIIGDVKETYTNLEHKGWDWRSFYNGWLEGRWRLATTIKTLRARVKELEGLLAEARDDVQEVRDDNAQKWGAYRKDRIAIYDERLARIDNALKGHGVE